MKTLLGLALIAAFAISGCTTPEPTIATPPLVDGKYEIRMLGSAFQPAEAKVPPGATVVWIGMAGVHDVTADDGSWSSDSDVGTKLNPGDRYERTFDQPGVVAYHCKIHLSTGMKGTLHIQD